MFNVREEEYGYRHPICIACHQNTISFCSAKSSDEFVLFPPDSREKNVKSFERWLRHTSF